MQKNTVEADCFVVSNLEHKGWQIRGVVVYELHWEKVTNLGMERSLQRDV